MTKKEQKEEQQLEELKELQTLQKAGKVPMRKANRDSSVEIPAHEYDGYVVVSTLTRNLNPDQKSFTDIRKNVKIHKDRFDAMVDAGGFVTFDDVKIVHDPRENPRASYEFRPSTVSQKSLDAAARQGASVPTKGSKELEKKANDLAAREQELSKKTEDFNKASEGLEARENTVATKEQELAKKEEELAKREAALKKGDKE